MTEVEFIVLETRHVPDTRSTEITVGTRDMDRVTVTVADSLVGSEMVNEVIRRALDVRRESMEALRPVDE